ncbi:hypothetical protein [Desulfobulbus sp.]|uniref:hypothetical protein n=1 Tax=Desulfobulbus sp. TaxID=895 RepID=UPI00286F70ED|nr:hypothetical protein [Desulfobulbus sp.]
MRCPKCGFTSFDHLETCKKCHKYLGDLCTELNGTAYDASPPLFLTFAVNEEEEIPVSDQFAGEQDESSLSESATLFSMEEVEAGEKASEEEEEQPQEAERYEIEFAGFGDEMEEMDEEKAAETPGDEEFMLEEEEPAEEPRSVMPSVDFGELDISDLAPPVTEQAEPIRFEQQPTLADLDPVAALSSTPPPTPPAPSAGKGQGGLEDLNISGLDLEAPAKLVTGSAAGKRFLPSVKTGTALDKFDIDLGDLFTDNKK